MTKHSGIKYIEKNGKSYVEMPRKVYQGLMQRIEDYEDMKEIKTIRKNKEETFPAEIVYKISLQGENPTKVYREYRQLTQEKLSEHSGISRGLIAQIETGKKTGSVTSLKAIAKALCVDLDMLT